MNCRDVRDAGDSFLSEESLTETNHEILRHLETCPPCRMEIEGRRRLLRALRAAFDHAPALQPRVEFRRQLRDQLRTAAVQRHRSWTLPGRWFALAAGLVLFTAFAGAMLLNRSIAPADALARDAIGDHRNCALKYRLVRTPVPLEEAAERFDGAFRLLRSAPPDEIATPSGFARVIERHSCAYGERRFGHVVMQYRGRVVSLLLTAEDGTNGAAASAAAIPHVIGRPSGGLSVVSVNRSHHAVLLVSDLGSSELAHLSKFVAVPLAQRLGGLVPDHGAPPTFIAVRSRNRHLLSSVRRSFTLPGDPSSKGAERAKLDQQF
jgi:hypothetical protein